MRPWSALFCLVVAGCASAHEARAKPEARAPAPVLVAPIADASITPATVAPRRALAPFSPSDLVQPPPAPGDRALEGDILVWQDAPLYVMPSEKAAHVRLSTSAEHSLGAVVPLHVVRDRGEWIETSWVGSANWISWRQTCTSSVLGGERVSELRLTWFVKRAAVAPVLAQPVTQSFPDGTSVALSPGLPVLPMKGGTHAVALQEDTLVLSLFDDDVRYAYLPPKPWNTGFRSEGDAYLAAEPGATYAIGDSVLSLSALSARAPAAPGFRGASTAHGVLFPQRWPCARATLDVEPSSLKPTTPITWSIGGPRFIDLDGVREGDSSRIFVQAVAPPFWIYNDTPVMTPTGHPLGNLGSGGMPSSKKTPGRTCESYEFFAAPLYDTVRAVPPAPRSERLLEICVRSEDVHRVEKKTLDQGDDWF